MNRREFLTVPSLGFAVTMLRSSSPPQARFRAVAFDGFTLFDPRPIAAALERQFPGRGAIVGDAWRSRLFEYQWRRALGGHYADFLHCAADSLRALREQMSLSLSDAGLEQLVSIYDQLGVWPDVPEALRRLHRNDVTLVMLSNMSDGMLNGALSRAHLTDLFTHVISSDRVRTFKPDPRVYALLPRVLRRDRSQILFAPFAGWDAVGAKWAGVPTFWVNRQRAGDEPFAVRVDGAGASLDDLVSFVLG